MASKILRNLFYNPIEKISIENDAKKEEVLSNIKKSYCKLSANSLAMNINNYIVTIKHYQISKNLNWYLIMQIQ